MSSNPYQPPSHFGEQAFPTGPQKPTAALVLGILNILFGALKLFGTVTTVALLFVPRSPQMQGNGALQLMDESSVYRIFTQVGLLLGFIASIVLVVSGIGLFQLRSYGRSLSIGYGIYAIAAAVLATIINIMYVFPAVIEKTNTGGSGNTAMVTQIGVILGICGCILGLIYPSVLLYFMFRPNVVAAFKK